MSPRRYSTEPDDPIGFTRRFDRAYSTSAGLYDFAVRRLPVWRAWIGRALPHVKGPRVLELSFGTGWLLGRLAGRVELHGADLNRRMVEVARRNLARTGARAALVQANVEHLPYRDAVFDTLVSTMAFTGYPDARRALGEMKRVLRPDGRMVLVDIAHPDGPSRLGDALVAFWKAAGDLIRDMGALFEEAGLAFTDEAIGGFGSVHLYVATPRERASDAPADAREGGSRDDEAASHR
jgi:ubiquinone/menaquinone biosynthesis C-methylase UbiE